MQGKAFVLSLIAAISVVCALAATADAEPLGSATYFRAGLNPGSSPSAGIAAGPDGNVWFTDSGTTKAIGRITPSGTITEFSAGLNANSDPASITAGPDGNLWFTDEGDTQAVGRITPIGTITEFATGGSSFPIDIAAGSDGNLWFTDQGTTTLSLARITPTGAINRFSSGLNPGSAPLDIASGPGGNLYFTDQGSLKAIGRIDPNTQTITEFSAGLNTGSRPIDVTAGDDGHLYFTDQGSPRAIGRMTPSGAITEVGGIPLASFPFEITPGADDNLWFSDQGSLGIGRTGPPVPAAAPPSSAGLFHLGKVRRNKNRGTATITVDVAGPGDLKLTGKGIVALRLSRVSNSKSPGRAITAGGPVNLTIRAKGAKRRHLKRTGKAVVRATVTYTATGAAAFGKSRRIKLVKNR